MFSHQQNFTKAFDWTQKLRSRYLHTLATFRIYERFRKLAAPNIVGKRKAEENVKTFGDYLYFFSPVQEASRCYFFIELAKFFDEDKKQRSQPLSINLLLDFVEKNLSSFSETEFLKYHSERQFIPELFKGYRQISIQDIRKIKRRLHHNKKIIENLKTYRDKFLAHDDVKKSDINITGTQINVLLRIIKDTIDLFYLKLEFSSNIYSNYDEEPVYAVDRVVKNLKEFEKERMRKINDKYRL